MEERGVYENLNIFLIFFETQSFPKTNSMLSWFNSLMKRTDVGNLERSMITCKWLVTQY